LNKVEESNYRLCTKAGYKGIDILKQLSTLYLKRDSYLDMLHKTIFLSFLGFDIAHMKLLMQQLRVLDDWWST